jgi:hypothetical protein
MRWLWGCEALLTVNKFHFFESAKTQSNSQSNREFPALKQAQSENSLI